jgi:hypothetical protein
MGRYESDGTVTTVAALSKTDDHSPASRRLAPGWKNLGRLVAWNGRSRGWTALPMLPARRCHRPAAGRPLGRGNSAADLLMTSIPGAPVLTVGAAAARRGRC